MTNVQNYSFITMSIPFSIQFLGIQSGSDKGGGGGGGGGRSTGGLLPFLLPRLTLRMSSGLKEGPGGGFFWAGGRLTGLLGSAGVLLTTGGKK